MANHFTANQADACTIVRCESFKVDGVHQYWVITVSDENGAIYEWKDESLPSTANLAAVRAAIKPYLMGIDIKNPPPVRSVDPLEEAIGQYVGDGSPY